MLADIIHSLQKKNKNNNQKTKNQNQAYMNHENFIT